MRARTLGSDCSSKLLHPCRARHVHSLPDFFFFQLPYAPLPCSRERRYVSVEAEFPAAYIHTAGFTDSAALFPQESSCKFCCVTTTLYTRPSPPSNHPLFTPFRTFYICVCIYIYIYIYIYSYSSLAVETSCTYSLYKYPKVSSRCVTYTYRACRVGRMRARRKKVWKTLLAIFELVVESSSSPTASQPPLEEVLSTLFLCSVGVNSWRIRALGFSSVFTLRQAESHSFILQGNRYV